MWSLNFLSRFPGVAPLILRLVVGFAFFAQHGLHKLRPGDWDFGASFVEKMSGSAPAPLLYAAAWVEFLAGFALILGFVTRWAALGLLGVMLYAVVKVHGGGPFADMELGIAYAGACLSIMFLGPGSFSLDRLFFGKEALIDK